MRHTDHDSEGRASRRTLAPLAALAALALAAALTACGGGSDASTATGVDTGLATTPAPAPPTETATTPPPQTQTQTQTQTAPQPTETVTTTEAPPPTAPTTTSTTPAPPDGNRTLACGQVRGGFIMDISSRGASCATARGVADSWLDKAAGGPGQVITVGEFRCTAKLQGESASVTCATGGAETITFHASP